ncbi:MAG: gephyrin-like molybdotransferase Glp [Gammaproteobacteria bacterium]
MAGCGCDDNRDVQQSLMPVDEALALLLDNAIPVTDIEKTDLLNARGRVLAENLVSAINVPPADNSAMDGYAVRSENLAAAAVEVSLPVSQRICAGDIGLALDAGTAARIFTGAAIPPEADAVVMQEHCKLQGDNVMIVGPVSAGTNVRRAGEDIRSGDTILVAGKRLKPQDCGLAASVGIAEIAVYRRLKVAIFSTGNELREPGEKLVSGQIYNSNRYTMTGLLQNLGCEVIDLGIIEDTLAATRDAMLKAADVADLVMTSGGVSVGEEDYIRIALEELGQLDMWRINIKPGKPLAFGKIAETPFLGMPGNPVSVFATFCVFARPYILKRQGMTDTKANSFRVPAGFEWKKTGKRCEYIRVRMETDKSGSATLSLFPHQGSGVLTSASWANGLAIIPPDTIIVIGDQVEFIPFSELFV